MKLWKKLICVLLALALSASMLSCGGTSDGETHTADGEDTASEIPKEPDSAENTEIPAKEPVKEGTFTDEEGNVRQVNTFKSEDGWVTFIVDAVVEGSEVTELPKIRVVQNHYDSAELKQITDAMAQGNTVYGYTETWTKAELDRVREDYQGLIDGYLSGEADNAPYFTEEERQEMVAEWQALVDHLDEDYANAPDELPYVEPVYEYGPESRYYEGKDYLDEYYGGSNTFLAVYKDGEIVMDIVAYDNTKKAAASYFNLSGDETYSVNTNVVYTAVNNKRNGSYRGTYTQKTPFTDEEIERATAEVTAVVENMGLGEWKLVEVIEFPPREGEEHVGYYLGFRFKPAFYDVPVEIASGDVWVYSTDEHNDVPAPSGTSTMLFSYSNGIILESSVDNDIEVVSETEPEALLSYDEMLDVIYGYAAKRWDFSSVQSQYYYNIYDENFGYNLYINKLSLEYIRTVSADDPDCYELVPAWVVYGYPTVVKYYIGNTTVDGVSTTPGYHGRAEDSLIPIAVFNAYDGTEITSPHMLGF